MKDLEHQEQKAFFQWVSMSSGNYPDLRLFHAIPNGGQRNVIVAAKLKAEGVKKGVLDTFLPVPRGGYYGLYIEFKAPGKEGYKNGGLTADQLFFKRRVIEQGYAAHVAYNADQAIRITQDYIQQETTAATAATASISTLQVAIADALQVLAEGGKEDVARSQNAATFELCQNAIERGVT